MIITDHAEHRMTLYQIGKPHVLAVMINGEEEDAFSPTGVPRKRYTLNGLVVVTESNSAGDDEIVVTTYFTEKNYESLYTDARGNKGSLARVCTRPPFLL